MDCHIYREKREKRKPIVYGLSGGKERGREFREGIRKKGDLVFIPSPPRGRG